MKSQLNRRGQETWYGEWSLKIFISWCITEKGAVVFGSEDHRTKRRFYRRKTKPREPKARERWERANKFFDAVYDEVLIVQSVHVEDCAALTVILSDGYAIRAIPTATDYLETLYFHTNYGPERSWFVTEDVVIIREPEAETQ